MKPLIASELTSFTRKYRFAGGKIRRWKVVQKSAQSWNIEISLRVKTALRELGSEPRPVQLAMRFEGVEEFRMQKRPSIPAGRIQDARFGYFQGLFFANFDAWGLEPGEVPKIHDYRGSDAFIGARNIWWQEVAKPSEQPR